MSRNTLIAVTVWKVCIADHLKLSRVREFGFPRLSIIIKSTFKLIFNPILPGGCSAPPLRSFAHNSKREKDNSTRFADLS